MSRFLIKSSVDLDQRGWRGAMAFVLGSIGVVLCWFWLTSAMIGSAHDPYGDGARVSLILAWIALIAAIFVALSGVVWLLVGRSFTHEVQVLPDQPK